MGGDKAGGVDCGVGDEVGVGWGWSLFSVISNFCSCNKSFFVDELFNAISSFDEWLIVNVGSVWSGLGIVRYFGIIICSVGFWIPSSRYISRIVLVFASISDFAHASQSYEIWLSILLDHRQPFVFGLRNGMVVPVLGPELPEDIVFNWYDALSFLVHDCKSR